MADIKHSRSDQSIKKRIYGLYDALGVNYSPHWLEDKDSFELVEREAELKKRLKEKKKVSNENFDYLEAKKELGIK